MSRTISDTAPPAASRPARRVRQQVRDAALLMGFSAGLALGCAGLLLALTSLVAG